MKSLLSLLVFSVSLFFFSCSSDSVIEPPPPPPGDLAVRTYSNLPADTAITGNFTYFRFRDSSIVTGSDTLTANWDIAFRATTIYINGGPVRFGNGGAIVQKNSNFDTVSVAPSSGYGLDTTNTQLAITTGSGNGWYTYDFSSNYITPTPGAVLIIRTGDGKYAKVEIQSYYKNSDPQPFPNPTNFRYYTFKYVYQPDGSAQIK